MGRKERLTIGKYTGKVNKEDPDRDWKDSKQHGKIKAPLDPASSSPKAGSKEQAQKDMSEKKPSKMGKFTERSSIKKSQDKTKKPPPKGR
ncbi:MAG: hypothetical protein RIC95_09470 [Vicingaceae bacterium]